LVSLPAQLSSCVCVTWIPFQGLPCFLVDARLHTGRSGSPVFTKPRTQFGSGTGSIIIGSKPAIFLLGVYSGPVEKWLEMDIKDMDLCAVWYAELLESIAAQRR
jgi:hypothetical protein